MAIAALSLIGFPPLVGFVGKFYLFVAGVESGHLPLVIIAGLNSAISAWYYLRLMGLPLLAMPGPQAETIVRRPVAWPSFAAVLTAVGVIVLPIFAATFLPARDLSGNGTDQPPIPTLSQAEPRPDQAPE